MVRVFHKHGLDTDLLEILPERFQSHFKAVQIEQRQIHNLASVTTTNELDAKSFSQDSNANDLLVIDHAA